LAFGVFEFRKAFDGLRPSPGFTMSGACSEVSRFMGDDCAVSGVLAVGGGVHGFGAACLVGALVVSADEGGIELGASRVGDGV
jgi:hypothetical protein